MIKFFRQKLNCNISRSLIMKLRLFFWYKWNLNFIFVIVETFIKKIFVVITFSSINRRKVENLSSWWCIGTFGPRATNLYLKRAFNTLMICLRWLLGRLKISQDGHTLSTWRHKQHETIYISWKHNLNGLILCFFFLCRCSWVHHTLKSCKTSRHATMINN